MSRIYFDQILQDLQQLSDAELVRVAQEEYGLDHVSEQDSRASILDACISIEQKNFFS